MAIMELRAVRNLIHASDPEAAEKEIKRFFE
jgi:nucleoside diphosphate kinase